MNHPVYGRSPIIRLLFGLSLVFMLVFGGCGGKRYGPNEVRPGLDSRTGIPPGMAVVVGRAYMPVDAAILLVPYESHKDGTVVLKRLTFDAKPSARAKVHFSLTGELAAFLVPAGSYYIASAQSQSGNILYRTQSDGLDKLTREPAYARLDVESGEAVYIGDIALMFAHTATKKVRFFPQDNYSAASAWFSGVYGGMGKRLNKRLLDFGDFTFDPVRDGRG